MPRPNWEWIKVDVLAPEHPKIEALSDKAFRALFTLWCSSGKLHTDGVVTAKKWKEWPPKVRAELISAGLAEPVSITGGVIMHDFDDHQRTKAEIDEQAERRSQQARKAAQARWGTGRPP